MQGEGVKRWTRLINRVHRWLSDEPLRMLVPEPDPLSPHRPPVSEEKPTFNVLSWHSGKVRSSAWLKPLAESVWQLNASLLWCEHSSLSFMPTVLNDLQTQCPLLDVSEHGSASATSTPHNDFLTLLKVSASCLEITGPPWRLNCHFTSVVSVWPENLRLCRSNAETLIVPWEGFVDFISQLKFTSVHSWI